MPELPEVEFGRRLAERIALGRVVERCIVADDRIVFDNVSPNQVERALLGRRVDAVKRLGKHLIIELDSGPHVLVHFGMTGALVSPDASALELAHGGARTDSFPPPFTKLELRLDDGGRLAFTNARRLGRVRLQSDPWGSPPLSKLGFDALTNVPTPGAFAERIKRRRVAIKSLLLDQSFAAGIGNWIADELLYQSRIAPTRLASDLSLTETRALHAALIKVVRVAVDVGADKDRFPKTWLFHHRWGRRAGAMTSRNEPIEFIEIGGRTTAWVPSRQS